MRTQADATIARRHRRPSSRFVLATAAAGLFLVALAVPNVAPSLRAARAEGTPGTFTAEHLSCVQHPGHEACSWDGIFEPIGGGPSADVSLYGGRHGLREGETTPAIDVGRGSRVYPPGGSREWIATGLVLLAGLALLVPLARHVVHRLRTRHGA